MMKRALVLLIVLGAGGCGFLPEDDFTGKRAGDGIAPWTDLGPAQVCLGNEFLGPPDTTPGGLCFASTSQEAPCTGDDDCRSREACVCGRCTVAYCATASDCSGGRVCSFSEHRCDLTCFDGGDCPDGAECRNGVCRGRCIDESDCQTGEVCSSQNVCVTADCAGDDDCLASERCRIQRTPRQVIEPSPASVDGQIVLWLEVSDPLQVDQTAIWRAVSRDGRHFTMSPAAPVLEDGNAARAPSVISTPEGWVMYYELATGPEIRVATSLDGIAWSAPETALAGGRAPSAVLLPDGTVAVYYQVGAGTAIALATGAPGGALTAQGNVIVPGDVTVPESETGPFWADVERVTSPFALLSEGAGGPSLRLYYSAFGRESGESVQLGEIVDIPPNYSVGYAAGDPTDPASMRPWPYGPIADRVSAFLDHREELSPAVVQLAGDDAYLLYYVEADPTDTAMGADGPFVIGRLGVLGNGAYAGTTGP
jgi:hypothetical protein